MSEMSPEIIAIITIGLGLAGLNLHLARETNRRFDDFNRRFDDFNRRFDDFNRRFEDLKTDVNRRFDDLKAYVDRRFDDVDRRFDDASRENREAHAHIAGNLSELRADFRAVIPRAAAEKTEAD